MKNQTWVFGTRLEVLGFLVRNGKVLLSTKQTKKGIGLLNGYGGGVENGESLLKALEREIAEETDGVKIDIASVEKVAIAEFTTHNPDGGILVCTVHVYFVHKWSGTPKTTFEMKKIEVFDRDNMPVERMFPADCLWVPMVMVGKFVRVNAAFAFGQKSVIGTPQVVEVDQSSLADERG